MSETGTQKQQSASERRVGIAIAVVFAIGVLYVASAYARFHQTEHGDERYREGRGDLCNEIKAKRPGLHDQLTADKLC